MSEINITKSIVAVSSHIPVAKHKRTSLQWIAVLATSKWIYDFQQWVWILHF